MANIFAPPAAYLPVTKKGPGLRLILRKLSARAHPERRISRMSTRAQEQALSVDDYGRVQQIANKLASQEWTDHNPATLKDNQVFVNEMQGTGDWDLMKVRFKEIFQRRPSFADAFNRDRIDLLLLKSPRKVLNLLVWMATRSTLYLSAS